MTTRKQVPIALTIAGSDSGGGAGIQADLNTFAALDVHGTTAITCLTAQNPRHVLAVQPASAQMVQLQLQAVFSELPPAACKTGMLYSSDIILAVAEHFSGLKGKHRPLLIVDPVMVSTSGAPLLKADAVRALTGKLLPLAALVTPNLDECELLLGEKIRDEEGLRAAARQIVQRFGCAALVKGGHLRGGREAIDIFFDGRTELLLSAPFVKGVATHGTGCTYSAAITACLAKGEPLSDAVFAAKQFITGAIANSRRVGRHQALGWS